MNPKNVAGKCGNCNFCNSLNAVAGRDLTSEYREWILRAQGVITELCPLSGVIPTYALYDSTFRVVEEETC